MNCHLRSIIVKNIPSIDDVDKKLYEEVLAKIEPLFGRITHLKLSHAKTASAHVYVIFANTSVHRQVIQHFEENVQPLFYGKHLIFAPAARISILLLNSLQEMSDSDHDLFCSRLDYNECYNRDIFVHNILNRKNIQDDLLDELKKDEYLFGPIESLSLNYKSNETNTMVILKYKNPYCHEEAIRYYNQLRPIFHGRMLFFESTIKLTRNLLPPPKEEEESPNPSRLIDRPPMNALINCHIRCVIIWNLPYVDDLRQVLYDRVLNEAELMFGPIVLFRIVGLKNTVFIEFADKYVHRRVIEHYQQSPPFVCGHTLRFKPARASYNIFKNLLETSNLRTDAELSSYEYENRDVSICFIAREADVEKDLLGELNRDADLFGPIDFFIVHYEHVGILVEATVRYADPSVHEHVIRHYNKLKPRFRGRVLFFEPSLHLVRRQQSQNGNDKNENEYVNNTEDWVNLNSAILIENILNKPNVRQELETELSKDECLFGPIESVRVVVDLESHPTMTQAFVRYVDRDVHERVVVYYNALEPKFYERALVFKLMSSLASFDDDDDDDDDSFDSETDSSISVIFKEEADEYIDFIDSIRRAKKTRSSAHHSTITESVYCSTLESHYTRHSLFSSELKTVSTQTDN